MFPFEKNASIKIKNIIKHESLYETPDLNSSLLILKAFKRLITSNLIRYYNQNHFKTVLKSITTGENTEILSVTFKKK